MGKLILLIPAIPVLLVALLFRPAGATDFGPTQISPNIIIEVPEDNPHDLYLPLASIGDLDPTPTPHTSDGICQKCKTAPSSDYGKLIRNAVKGTSVPASLVEAVMRVESGGNPNATSKSGAVGLLQIMPRDGIAASFYCPNGPCFAGRPSMADLYDPKFNIEYGVGMLEGLFRKYGNWRDALFHYGPRDVGYYYADKVIGAWK